jgi:hypothetical protein
MRSWPLVLLLTGCGAAPLSTTLTAGVQVDVPGCAFSVTTANETTEPVHDDGRLGAAPTPRAQHVAFRGDPATSMTLVWETDFDTTATVAEVDGVAHKGFSYAYPTDFAGNDPPSVRVHEVTVCGLTPGTMHTYRVGGGGMFSPDATFTTAPSSGTTRIIVLGDSRDAMSVFGQALQAGQDDGADLAVFTGDAVLFGGQQDLWDSWFAAAAATFPSLPLASALGNHEANARHYYAQLPGPGNQQWYSFDWGDLHITVLNDTPVDPATIGGDQARFLDDDLARTQKPFKLVVHHKPVYTSYEGADITGHMHEAELEEDWVPLYEKHNVDLVLNGHVHAFERTFPLRGGQPVADGAGPVYAVFGGAGASQVDVAPRPFIAKQLKTFGYELIDVAGSRLTLTSKALDGSVLDEYSITH